MIVSQNQINMSTYTQILYQLVFGTKDYTQFLNQENESILFQYIAGVLRNQSCHPYIVGGYGNHIHVITHIHPTVALSSIVKDIKVASHKRIQEEKEKFLPFPGWQVGYGAFTYHISARQNLIRYVENQKEHHGNQHYKEELALMLKEHEVEYIDDDYFLL